MLGRVVGVNLLAYSVACSVACSLACSAGTPSAAPQPASTPTAQASPSAANAEADAETKRQAELAHEVVFADRITASYVLLLRGSSLTPPTRKDLNAMVQAAFPNNLEDDEVGLLRDLIARPLVEGPAPEASHASDLIGLAIEVHPRRPSSGPALVEDRILDDPDLGRALSDADRASLPDRQTVLVLRAQYRHQHGLRGLRLLQTLVWVVATHDQAIVHDPDTLETTDAATFATRRFQTTTGATANQVVIVPFPDTEHPGSVRLTTRGMRRFGSVDLELGGLPQDLLLLQQGSDFLHGLARAMVDLGELHPSGLASGAPEVISVHHSDCIAAYAGLPGPIPSCDDCPGFAEVHLVERPPKPQDTIAHPVARVVAPRPRSDDAQTYDHPAWVREALAKIFGARPGPE